jgi:type IV pilus assembly protein PilN
MVRQLPDGVYLKALKQTGQRVTINGMTQSQARVSTLIRNIEASPVFAQPGLVEIKAAQQAGLRSNEFTLNMSLKRPTAGEAKK